MFVLGKSLKFPPVDLALPDGLLAIGGDLQPERLLLAYSTGIFPWYEEDSVIMWWSPDPRFVLFPDELRVSKSMRQFMRNTDYRVTENEDFESVIANCAKISRKGQQGTWITAEMQEAYVKLHQQGHARSVEVWDGEELVGGLYGIDLGHVFCGESMFAKRSNASKLAFIYLVEKLEKAGYSLIDCQVYTDHLYSLGAREIPREEFLEVLGA